MLSTDLFAEHDKLGKIGTRRLNQDIVENKFSMIRSRGGNNRNPSAREFNYILRIMINMENLLPQLNVSSSNCLIDKDLEKNYQIPESLVDEFDPKVDQIEKKYGLHETQTIEEDENDFIEEDEEKDEEEN